MRRVFSRFISLLLVLAMVLSFIPILSRPVYAATQNQQNIVDRANYMYNLTWVAQETIYGWRYQYTFEKGQTYRVPYAQPIYAGYYIGYGVTIETFLEAAATAGSVFYTEMSTYNNWDSTYYGTDCSAYVSWCWGCDRKTTYSIPQVSTNYGYATESNIRNYLQLGDALNSNGAGHVVLCTDLSYDAMGNLIQIEITEQTPPQLKRSYFTPAELAEKYAEEYTIQRYTGTVPAAPVSGYLSSCTSYAAHCTLDITAATDVRNLPCAASVDSQSTVVTAVATGETVTGVGLYVNTLGEQWYKVITADNQTGYIPASGTVYVDDITTDITITGATTPNGHVKGNIFYVEGTIASKYNKLSTAAVYVHEGFGSTGTKVTGASDSVASNTYTLKGSNIDNATAFNQVPLGENTYIISADYINYYVEDGEIKSNSGTVNLVEEYFVVVSSSVSQTTCAHSYSDTTTAQADCANTGEVVHACGTCGYIYTETTAALGHSFGDWEGDTPTCTESVAQTQTCTACGEINTQTLPATGHDYAPVELPGNCQNHPRTEYICGTCGDSYITYADSLYTDWSETAPTGIDESLIQSKHEYRYSDYEILTSTDTLDGYTLVSSAWVETGRQTVTYVDSWNSGFDTTNSLYTLYNNKANKVTASETDTAKTEIESDAVVGYLWFHWCTGSSATSVVSKSGNYTTFHAYYSTEVPGVNTSDYDTSDGSYKLSASTACASCVWYWPIAVYAQESVTSEYTHTYERWTDWSAWSEEPVSATDTRQVEERTLYRYIDAALGDHDFVDGICSVCGANGCDHSYTAVTTDPTCTADGSTVYTCSLCGSTKTEILPALDHNYDSVVTEPTCTDPGYTTHTCATCSDTYTDSATDALGHSWANGTCVTCGATCQHSYEDGICTSCGLVREYFLFGWINGGNYACEENAADLGEYKFENGKLIVTFTENSYVAVKTNDGGWYMTDGWLGEEVTSAILYSTSVVGDNANKLFVPGGVEITFTLTLNTDDTMTLSYEVFVCQHESHTTDGFCTACGAAVEHTYEVTTTEATCTEDGSIVYTCACGDTYSEVIPAAGHSYEAVTTDATCTQDGATVYTCHCGDTYSETIPALGHDYASRQVEGSCQNHPYTEYTCGICGDCYKVYDESVLSDWQTEYPNVDASLIESKTQYRFSDYETTTSYETTLEGYTQVGSTWVAAGTTTVAYVPTWNTGFDTTSALYAQYNNVGSKVTASETETTKVEIDSDEVAGYLWFHWCTGSSATSVVSKSGSYTTFHAYYSTEVPGVHTSGYDTSDGSYKLTGSTACASCIWYWPVAVYEQQSTTYQNLFTYERWTDWSDWSDEEVTASDTRQVETQAAYRYVNASLADHNYESYTIKPSCTGDGCTTYTCATCGDTYEETIPATGHSHESTTTAATCTVDGKIVYTCTCGDTYEETIPATGHSYTGVTTNATCTADGKTVYTCGSCGDSYEEVIPATGHSYVDGICSGCGEAEPSDVVIPSTNLTGVSLAFEDEILYNIYFTADDLSSVVEMGLVTFNEKLADGTIENAIDVIPGYEIVGSEVRVHTNGIPAKNMGDALYFRVYALLTDGS